ncbi:MAG TPA: aldehyde dehydrogenase family protein [Polyangiales bacterium]|nr:aldehyde dehydrogenase family protein [Polyangiales bacterium]
MAALQQTISPIDGSVYVEREFASAPQIDAALAAAASAQRDWRATPLAERAALCSRLVDAFVAQTATIAEELTWQIGRPIAHSPFEMRGFADRARRMIELAPEALADLSVGEKAGFTRFIRRDPLGVVLVLSPWNYPYLTSVNAVIPALLAGNTVILKHALQTPLCAERYSTLAREVGFPSGVLQHVHCTHDDVARMIGDPRVGYVAFTGSVAGGHAVERAARERFIGSGLELGGKDPAYVRADADLAHAVENLVDGAFFNCGQSCCGIERIYVDKGLYPAFVDGYVELTRKYVLGDPREASTTLGPLVRTAAADAVRAQTAQALAEGARALIDEREFAASRKGTPYLAPQVLVDVTQRMRVMRDESFGPVVGIMAVDSDEQAIALMNDSRYGLTASIWTQDTDAALRIGDQVDTGTWYMNRCDYLDPALAWTGVKDSGRGCTLSRIGLETFTRPKSFHMRLKP